MKTYINKTLKISLLIFVLLGVGGCKNFLDINTNPNYLTQADPSLLLPVAEVAIANGVGLNQLGVSHGAETYMHQVTSGFEALYNNNYINGGSSTTVTGAWQTLYSTGLYNLESIISSQTTAGNWAYVGIAKVLKAYTYSVLVDVWGNVPYTQAVQYQKYPSPVYDNGKDIYTSLLALLDEAVTNLGQTSPKSPVGDDIIYTGNSQKWIALANTLKIRLLNQISKVDNTADGKIATILTSSVPLMTDNTFDFQVKYGTSQNPDNRHPAYIDDYKKGQKIYEVSPYFWEILADKTPVNPIFAGVGPDPRLPYYFYNQTKGTAVGSALNPIPDYFDNSGVTGNGVSVTGAMVSSWFESSSAKTLNDISGTQTMLGLYPIGGKYDDNSFTPIAQTGLGAGGAVPQQLFPYHEFLFLKAELASRGVVAAGDATTLYTQAMQASFDKVNQIAMQNGAPLISQANITTYINNVLAKGVSLEAILTQKWIAMFGNGLESYNDYRRTGFPKVYDPRNDPKNTCPVALPYTSASHCTRYVRSTPTIWPYPIIAEQLVNSNTPVPSARNTYTDKVFWMP